MYKKNLLKLYDPKYDIKQSVQLWLFRYSYMAQNVQIIPVEVIWPLICYEAVSASVTLEIL